MRKTDFYKLVKDEEKISDAFRKVLIKLSLYFPDTPIYQPDSFVVKSDSSVVATWGFRTTNIYFKLEHYEYEITASFDMIKSEDDMINKKTYPSLSFNYNLFDQREINQLAEFFVFNFVTIKNNN